MSIADSHYQTIALGCDYPSIRFMKKSDKKVALAEKNRTALRYWKDGLGLTVAGWCSKSGISEGTLRNFLSGHSQTIEIDTLSALADSIGLTIGELLDGPNSKKGSQDAMVYTFKMLIKALLETKKTITKDDLKKDVIYALDRFRDDLKPGAVEVMGNLLEFLKGLQLQENSPTLRKLSKLSPPV